MKEIFQTVSQALRTEQPIALVTVVRSIGSTPRHAAAKMAVRADGSFVGTIGGGSMERKAIQDAMSAMAEGLPRLIEYPLIGKTAQSMGLCGGTQEVFIDVLNAGPANGRRDRTCHLFEAVVAACKAGEPTALVTVINSYDKEAWQAGEKVLLNYDTSTYADKIDGNWESRILAAAQEALQQNRSLRLGYQPKVDAYAKLNSLAREPLEFFIDVVQPRAELFDHWGRSYWPDSGRIRPH